MLLHFTDDIKESSVRGTVFWGEFYTALCFKANCVFFIYFHVMPFINNFRSIQPLHGYKNITWRITELVTDGRCGSHVCHRFLFVLFEIRSVVWRWVCRFIVETVLMHWHPAWKNACVRRENFIHIRHILWNMKKQGVKFKKNNIIRRHHRGFQYKIWFTRTLYGDHSSLK
jgi:hypothetical protein